MGIDAKSGQLIECANPEHWKLGSIHYIQPDCVAKQITEGDIKDPSTWIDWDAQAKVNPTLTHGWRDANAVFRQRINEDGEVVVEKADSDESWQASEALLKR